MHMKQIFSFSNLARSWAVSYRLTALLLVAATTLSWAQTGYIYVHKKAQSEDTSPDFPFTVSGGSTTVPAITLNDQPTNLEVRDLGTTSNGGLYAVAGASSGNNPVYYRAVNSSSWSQVAGLAALRIDGGPANTHVHVNSAGNVFYYNGTTTTNLNATNGVDVAFDRSGTNRVFYTNQSGAVFYKSATNPASSFSAVSGIQATRIDVAPNGLLVSNSANGNVYVSNFDGSGVVNLGDPNSFTGAVTDVAVADDGTIYVTKPGLNGDTYPTVYRYTGGYAAGGSWIAEVSGRGLTNLTGGIAGQVWGQLDLEGADRTIWSRTDNGFWLDDERVRTSPNTNSELVAVAPGTYTVTEGTVSGWSLNSISLDDPSNNSTGSVSSRSASVNVSAGEVVHVTFQNNLILSTAVTNTCTESVFLETFGTGTTSTYGAPLTGLTTYHYSTNGATNQVQDGYYTIISNTTQAQGALTGVYGDYDDHTSGDGTGRLAFFNANYAQDEFYRRRFTGLLPGTQYSFSAWVLSVNNFPIKPNVRFEINDPGTGATLSSINTGNITSAGVWQQYQLVFTASQSDVEVVLRNNNVGGFGNDLAIDDISFGLARPLQPVASATNASCTTGGTVTVSSPVGPSLEYSINGSTFQSSPTFTAVGPGSYSVTARFTGSVGCVSTPRAVTVRAAICGNVFNDANGLLGTPANTVDGPGVNGTTLGLYASLVSGGSVVATVPVTATGTYNFTNVAPGSYSVVLTTTSTGSATPSVPTNYTNTGENVGAGAGSDGTPNGVLPVTVSTTSVTNANFGIERRPVVVADTDSPRSNPGGTIASPVSSTVFAGTDPEDGTYANNLTGRTVTLTPATNGTLYYNGTPVTSTTAITGFDPTKVTLDPAATGATTGTGGASPDPTFTYSVLDNAGVPSVPQTITVPFTGPVAPAALGYIYLHKKALSEDISPDFPFTVSGGSTSVPAITLNDQDLNIDVRDVGATGNGGLYAVAGNTPDANGDFEVYYRPVNSATWINTNAPSARIDGGPANTYIRVKADGAVFYFNGTTTISLGGTDGVEVAFDKSGTNRVFYTNATNQVFYRDLDDLPGGSWTPAAGLVSNRVDAAPNGQIVFKGEGIGGTNNVYIANFDGTALVNLGAPSSTTLSVVDVGVADDGIIYATANGGFGEPVVFRYTGGYAAGGSWVAEPTSRGMRSITGGVGGQLWGQFNLPGVTRSIWSRTSTGVWLDDERVRTSPNTNSELVAVAPGTYTITEGAVSGWSLSSISLDDPSNNSTGSVSSRSASINVSAGEVVHVTFQNNLIQSTAVTNTCTESVFLETFGTGSNTTFGTPLTGQTAYHYRNASPVQDGYYGVVSNTSQIGGFGGNFNDHTSGNGTGRLVFFNANYAQDEFYRRRITGLLPGTQYSFSTWVLNVNDRAIKPNVRFEINDPASGANLTTNNTGDITSVGVWQQYQLVFTATQSSVDIVLRNNNIGGSGNDLAIDDISFGLARPLQPVVSATNPNCNPTTTGTITVNSPVGPSLEYSLNGTTYQSSPTFTAVAPGSYSVTARFTGSVGCVSDPTSVSINACPQPVSLVSFTAQAQADRTVLLNWKTSWESANKGYLIERSKDLKNFEQVGQVTDVAGTSNSINSYQFVDKNPYRGTSYYRLVQVDLDGSRHTYKAEPVVINGRYGVYPNPVVGSTFTLELDEPASAILHLYDISGREVSVSKSAVTELSLKVSPAVGLSPGVYVLTVEERGILRKHRLVVQ